MPRRGAVGASAGGVEALTTFAAGLPADLPYAVLVALHLPPTRQACWPRSSTAMDRCPRLRGHGGEVGGRPIYVAAPDRHLLVDDHRVVLSEGPTENGHRPAINALFRSAAFSFGPDRSGCCSREYSTTVWSEPRPSAPGAAPPSPNARRTRCFRPCRSTRLGQGLSTTRPRPRRSAPCSQELTGRESGSRTWDRDSAGAGEPDRDGKAVSDSFESESLVRIRATPARTATAH